MKKICWLICIVALFAPAKAFSFSITMAPISTSLSLGAKKNAKSVIEIKNTCYVPLKLKVSASAFVPPNENEAPSFSSAPFTPEKWITVTPTDLTVRPYDYGVIRFEVRVPEDLALTPGTYMAAIMIAETKEPQVQENQQEKQEVNKQAKAGFTIGVQVAHNVFIDIGEPTYDVKIESLEVKPEENKPKFSLRLRNLGKFNFPAKGEIKIESGNKKVEEVYISESLVLRNSSKTIAIDVPSKLAPGSYEALVSLDMKKDKKLEARFPLTIPSQ